MIELEMPGAGVALATIRLLSNWEEAAEYMTVRFSKHEWDNELRKHVPAEPHFVTYMDCSDTFFWGGSDAEDVTEENFATLEATVTEIKPMWVEAEVADRIIRGQEADERTAGYAAWKATDPEDANGWGKTPEFKAISDKYRPLYKAEKFASAVSDLFAARVRQQRPQGAAYKVRYDPSLWDLFNECGPEREIGLGNPRKPGQ